MRITGKLDWIGTAFLAGIAAFGLAWAIFAGHARIAGASPEGKDSPGITGKAAPAAKDAAKPEAPAGDRILAPMAPDEILPEPSWADLRAWNRDMERWLREMRDLTARFPRTEGDLFRDLRKGFAGIAGPERGVGRVLIEIWDNGRHARYEESETGAVKALTEEGGKTQELSAASRGAFLKEHPDLARRFGLLKAEVTGPEPSHRSSYGWLSKEWRDFLKGFRPPRILARPSAPSDAAGTGERLGIGAMPVPWELRTYLKLGPEEGLYVHEVLGDTLAARLGIERGDILLKIGERPVGSPADVATALASTKKGDALKVLLLRAGEKVTKTATR